MSSFLSPLEYKEILEKQQKERKSAVVSFLWLTRFGHSKNFKRICTWKLVPFLGYQSLNLISNWKVFGVTVISISGCRNTGWDCCSKWHALMGTFYKRLKKIAGLHRNLMAIEDIQCNGVLVLRMIKAGLSSKRVEKFSSPEYSSWR